MILQFKTDVPLELTMMFEDCYEPELAMTLEEKREVCKIPVWLYVNGLIAGEIYGAFVDDIEEPIPDVGVADRKSVYCYSVTVLPQYRRRGLGSILHAYWLGMCHGKTVIGHATSDEMMSLASKFCARFFNSHANWYGTNRIATFYKIQRQ